MYVGGLLDLSTEKEQSPNVARERSFGGCKDSLVEDTKSYLDKVTGSQCSLQFI